MAFLLSGTDFRETSVFGKNGVLCPHLFRFAFSFELPFSLSLRIVCLVIRTSPPCQCLYSVYLQLPKLLPEASLFPNPSYHIGIRSFHSHQSIFEKTFIFMCMNVCCMYVCAPYVCPVPPRDGRSPGVKAGDKASIQVFGTKPESSETVARVLNHQGISSSCIEVILTETSVCGLSCNGHILQGLMT